MRNTPNAFQMYNPDSAELSLSSCLVKTVIVSSVMWEDMLSFQNFKIFFKKTQRSPVKSCLMTRERDTLAT